MKSVDVIIEKINGHYRASIPTLPDISSEADSRDEALFLVRQAAEAYLARVEVASIEIPSVIYGSLREFVPPSNAVQNWAATADSVAEQSEMKRQTDFTEAAYPIAEGWLRAAHLSPKDPNDPLYQEYLAELAADKQRQREEAGRDVEVEARRSKTGD